MSQLSAFAVFKKLPGLLVRDEEGMKRNEKVDEIFPPLVDRLRSRNTSMVGYHS